VAAPEQFDVRVETTPQGMVVVGVRGELDLAAAEAFEDAIASVRDASHVVVDLTDCTFLDSSGVRALSLSARDITERGARIDVVASNPAVLRVLEITRVDSLAPVHESRDAIV